MARMPRLTAYPLELREAIQELCPDSLFDDLKVHGNAQWTPARLLMGFVLMSWLDAQTLTSRFWNVRDLLARLFEGWMPPSSYSGYAQALQRWMEPILERVRFRLQERLRRIAGAKWRTHGWVVFAADGSRFESPRTRANEKGLQCAGKARTAPQVFHTTLLHLGTNALWDFRTGPGTASERRHLEDMAASLPAGSLVVADAGFIGFELVQRLRGHHVSVLLRVGANITLLCDQLGARLRREGREIWLWPEKFQKQPPLILRLLVVRRGHHPVYLVTDVLDPKQLSFDQAAALYRQRWGIEVAYRTIKQTLDRSAWLSRTPGTVLAEHTSTILGVWLLSVLSLEALAQHRHDPRAWSPSQARDITRRVLRLALDRRPHAEPPWRAQLGQCLRDRYVRRRPKKARSWPHKKRDPPTKPPKLRNLTRRERAAGERLLNPY